MTKCQACDADIVWAITKGAKRMPVDAEPHPDGNIELLGHGDSTVAYVHTAESLDLFGPASGPRHRSHFATCPRADEFRRR